MSFTNGIISGIISDDLLKSYSRPINVIFKDNKYLTKNRTDDKYETEVFPYAILYNNADLKNDRVVFKTTKNPDEPKYSNKELVKNLLNTRCNAYPSYSLLSNIEQCNFINNVQSDIGNFLKTAETVERKYISRPSGGSLNRHRKLKTKNRKRKQPPSKERRTRKKT